MNDIIKLWFTKSTIYMTPLTKWGTNTNTNLHTQTHIHTPIYVCVYIYMCVCVCVCVCNIYIYILLILKEEQQGSNQNHWITGHHTSCTLLFSPLPIIENGFGEKGCFTKIYNIHLKSSDVFTLQKIDLITESISFSFDKENDVC